MANDANGREKVTVIIHGDVYKLVTDDNPQYIKELGLMVDSRMNKIGEKSLNLSGKAIGVLTALELADEYMKLKKEYDEILELLDEN